MTQRFDLRLFSIQIGVHLMEILPLLLKFLLHELLQIHKQIDYLLVVFVQVVKVQKCTLVEPSLSNVLLCKLLLLQNHSVVVSKVR